ncbi:PREDICTED: ankycorbin-like [Amphimedon queenslandica]|uniref:Uncharacterized protein n=1 Tax=Amphimedon queenslandica TaxID=400682 RepID=A0A1X7V169_AMPQE|nr:PREDICTED: ankycorbin-like [Amphimedon queenslandica]|eukprot:XP_019851364.1 PREDICTED: ankycorbin-like [Amphimedon queenslandica]
MNASEQLIKAAKSGNLKEVKKLLSKGAFFAKDEFGNTALHEASWTGNNDIVKVLLKASCFVDSVNGAGFTPLHLASQNGHAKVAKTLLKWKANPAIKNQHEEAAIHLIAKYDHSHLVPIFAAAKVNLDITAKDGNTALHIAAKLGYAATVKALVQSGANPNFTNIRKRLPIDYAEIGDYHDTVKLLIPLTERPVVMGRRATMDSRSKTPDSTPLYAKRSVFSRSSKSMRGSSSGVIPRKTYDSPPSVNGVELRPRDRSVSVTTPPKRYSREFEDLPPRLYTFSSAGRLQGGRSPLVLSMRSNTRTPSLEEMPEISVEETLAKPNYKYIPTQSDDSEDNSSVTYKPLLRISCHSDVVSNPPTLPRSRGSTSTGQISSLNTSMPNLAITNAGSNRSSAVFSPSPLAGTPNTPSNPIYDYLSPKVSSPSKSSVKDEESDSENDSYVCLSPRLTSDKRTSPDGQDDSFTVLSDDVLHHQYEYLGPLPDEDELEDDFESYVYMAPRDNGHLPLQNTASSPKNGAVHKLPGSSCTESPVRLPYIESNKKTVDSGPTEHKLVESIRQSVQSRLQDAETHCQRRLQPSLSAPNTNGVSSRRPNSWVDNLQPVRDDETADIDSDEDAISFVADSYKNGNGEEGIKVQETLEKYKTEVMEYCMKQAEKKMRAMEEEYQRKIQELTVKTGSNGASTGSPKKTAKRSSETFV